MDVIQLFRALFCENRKDVYEELSVLNWRQLYNARRFNFPDAPPIEGALDDSDESSRCSL